MLRKITRARPGVLRFGSGDWFGDSSFAGLPALAQLLDGPESCSVLHFFPDFRGFCCSNGSGVVGPPLPGVGENVGDVLIAQVDMGRHDVVEFLAVHFDGAHQSLEENLDGHRRVSSEPVRSVQRREGALHADPFRTVAGNAGAVVDGFSAFVNRGIDLVPALSHPLVGRLRFDALLE